MPTPHTGHVYFWLWLRPRSLKPPTTPGLTRTEYGRTGDRFLPPMCPGQVSTAPPGTDIDDRPGHVNGPPPASDVFSLVMHSRCLLCHVDSSVQGRPTRKAELESSGRAPWTTTMAGRAFIRWFFPGSAERVLRRLGQDPPQPARVLQTKAGARLLLMSAGSGGGASTDARNRAAQRDRRVPPSPGPCRAAARTARPLPSRLLPRPLPSRRMLRMFLRVAAASPGSARRCQRRGAARTRRKRSCAKR